MEPSVCAVLWTVVDGTAWRSTEPNSIVDTAVQGEFTSYSDGTAKFVSDEGSAISFVEHSLNASQECLIVE